MKTNKVRCTNRILGVGRVRRQERASGSRLVVVHRLVHLGCVGVVLDLLLDAARIDGIANHITCITIVRFRTGLGQLAVDTARLIDDCCCAWRRSLAAGLVGLAEDAVGGLRGDVIAGRARRLGLAIAARAAVGLFVVGCKRKFYSQQFAEL